MQDTTNDWRIDGRWLISGDLRIPVISGGAPGDDDGDGEGEGGGVATDDGDGAGESEGDGEGEGSASDPAAEARAEADREREGRIRAEERARLLEQQQRPPAAETKDVTRDDIEAQFAAGKITEAQRIDLIADLRVKAALAERDARTEAARPVEKAADRLEALIAKYPDLNDPNSETLKKVTAQLRDLAGLGFDPKDVRTQLLATERVVGGHQLGGGGGVNGREFNRGKVPVGGSGGGGGNSGGGGGGKKDPLAHVPRAQIEHWKSLGYTREQMEGEAPYVRARPNRGFA